MRKKFELEIDIPNNWNDNRTTERILEAALEQFRADACAAGLLRPTTKVSFIEDIPNVQPSGPSKA